ncbi:hypothetical protein BDW60DRAFT_211575 [Aspergillus nidulans var. acristatus]
MEETIINTTNNRGRSAAANGRTGKKSCEISLRRRLQNRIAQRKFREKAKLRKERRSQAVQNDLNPSMPSDAPDGYEAEMYSRPNSNHTSSGHCGVELDTFLGREADAQNACWSNVSWKPGLWSFTEPLLPLPQPTYTPNNSSLAQAYLQAPKGLSSPSLEPSVENNRHPIDPGRLLLNQQVHGEARSPPRRAINDDKQSYCRENALATLAKQTATFREEGAELFGQLGELYNLGVLLHLVVPDSGFQRLLATAKKRFFASMDGLDPELGLNAAGPYNDDSATSYESDDLCD